MCTLSRHRETGVTKEKSGFIIYLETWCNSALGIILFWSDLRTNQREGLRRCMSEWGSYPHCLCWYGGFSGQVWRWGGLGETVECVVAAAMDLRWIYSPKTVFLFATTTQFTVLSSKKSRRSIITGPFSTIRVANTWTTSFQGVVYLSSGNRFA